MMRYQAALIIDSIPTLFVPSTEANTTHLNGQRQTVFWRYLPFGYSITKMVAIRQYTAA